MMTATLALPKVLRTISGYCVEWHHVYSSGLYAEDHANKFTFLPGSFNRCLSRGGDIKLTQDLDSVTIFASIADGTLRLVSDEVGLLVEADLLDSPVNRVLCQQIDAGKIRGWSHKFSPFMARCHRRTENGVKFTDYVHAELEELALVIRKVPRAKSRITPVFLSGGPKGI